MGNYTVVLTEGAGLITFHKGKETKKGEVTYFLFAKNLPQIEKRENSLWHSRKKDEELYIEQLTGRLETHKNKLKLIELKIAESFETKYVDLQHFIDEDLNKIIHINRDRNDSKN